MFRVGVLPGRGRPRVRRLARGRVMFVAGVAYVVVDGRRAGTRGGVWLAAEQKCGASVSGRPGGALVVDG